MIHDVKAIAWGPILLFIVWHNVKTMLKVNEEKVTKHAIYRSYGGVLLSTLSLDTHRFQKKKKRQHNKNIRIGQVAYFHIRFPSSTLRTRKERRERRRKKKT